MRARGELFGCVAAAALLFALPIPQSMHAQVPGNNSATTGQVVALAEIDAVNSNPPMAVQRDGLWFSTDSGSTQLHVHGYAQLDNRMFSNNIQGAALDTFVLRRIRPIFEGSLFRSVDFRFMPDFGESNPQIQESYLELNTLPFAKLRVGKFKEPIGLEVLRSDRDLTFVERSLASDLVPLRYIGAQLSGSVLSESISYEAGYFNGANDGSNGSMTWLAGNEGAGRVFVRPFAGSYLTSLQHFGIGIAGSAGNQRGPIAGLKTVGQSSFFTYSSATQAAGGHNRIAPQAYFYAGAAGAMFEYVSSSQGVINAGRFGQIRNDAWQIAGSYVVTGEKNTYGGVRVRSSFDPRRGFSHLGALEIAVRSSQLRINGNAFPVFASPESSPQQAHEYGIGMNWYLNNVVKLVSNFEHTTFGKAPTAARVFEAENVLVSRLQLAF